MKKRIISAVLVLIMLLGTLPLTAGAESYWDAQAAYNAALELGDDDAILDAVERICAVYPNPTDKTEYTRVMFPVRNAAEIYEKRGDFNAAAECYAVFLEGAEYMCSIGEDYTDYLKTVGMLYKHNSVKPTVYAETSDPNNIPFYGAKTEERAGVAHGMCEYFDKQYDNAQLYYVQFFNETMESFKWKLPKDTDDYTLVVGWNVPNENLEDLKRVANGEADDYIRSNLEWLSTLKCRVLIRFGAEINCWSALPGNKEAYDRDAEEFIDTFKAAFRKIATMADTYAPDAGMIYSPNDVSNWYFTPEDFYPGDEYVDWVGMSTYINKSSSDSFELSDGKDAFYCTGDYYRNQIIRIEEIVETFSDRKPIIITEGGYSYESEDGVQTEEHAADAMRYFYTYVSRVYPQIKCIMYFNAGPGDSEYKLFTKDGVLNQRLADLYRSLNTSNVAMEYSMGRSTACGYTELWNIDEVTESLNLSVYASYPTKEDIRVTYTVDGKVVSSSAEYPYAYNISVPELGVGGHLLKVTTTCMQTTDTQFFKLTVAEDGRVTVSEPVPQSFTDVPRSFWGYEYVAYGMATGLFAGTSDTTFNPNDSMTRAMFVTVLARLHGMNPDDYTTADFDDVEDGMWYTPYIAWAAENGIVNGVSATEFAPMEVITREQLCTIIVRYCDKFGVSLENDLSHTDDTFLDDSDISDYASQSVYRAKYAGIIAGKGDGKFYPAASATRAECATIFMRLCSMYF